MHATDAELVTRAAAGERDAFEQLHRRHVDTVHDHLVRWCRDPALAADATQEAFVALLPRLGELRDGQAVLAWLLRTGRNRAIDQLRRTRRETTVTPFSDDRVPSGVLGAVATDRAGAPQAAAETAEAAQLVWDVAAGLDERTFSVLDLHVRQGLDAGEIAEVLGTSRSNANQLVHRMRERMRTLFGAVVLLPVARGSCAELASLAAAAPDPLGLADARAIEAHADGCATCEPARRRAVAPLRAYGALAQVRAPASVQATIGIALDAHFAGGSAGGPPRRGVRRGIVGALLGLLLLLGAVGGVLAVLEPPAPDTVAVEPAPVATATATDADVDGEPDATDDGETREGSAVPPATGAEADTVDGTPDAGTAPPPPAAPADPGRAAPPPPDPGDGGVGMPTDGPPDGPTDPAAPPPSEDPPSSDPSDDPTEDTSPSPDPVDDPVDDPSPDPPDPSPDPSPDPDPPLELTVLRPGRGTQLADGAALGVLAEAVGGTGVRTIRWSSDLLPGQTLLTGSSGRVGLRALDCRDTTHQLTATVTDAAGTSAASSIPVLVVANCPDPLDAAILRPGSGMQIGAEVGRDGSWSAGVGVLGDASGGVAPYAWEWLLGGEVVAKGEQASITVDGSACDRREVTIGLRVTDAAGATASASVGIVVVPAC